MKIQIVDILSISQEKSLRQDYDFHKYRIDHMDNYYIFNELFELIQTPKISTDELYCNFQYCEIGNADKSGDISPTSLNFEERNLINENYYRKIEKGDIISVNSDDILISKVRPNLKKYIRITDDLTSVYFTSAFIRIKAKIMPVVIYYCLRTVFYNDIVAISRQGKGYPTLNEKDLVCLKFNKKIVDVLQKNENELKEKITSIESQIRELKVKMKPVQAIIDEVLSAAFSIDTTLLYDIDNAKIVSATLSLLSYNNSNLRFSYRWNKAIEIQEKLIRMSDCFYPLGKYIVDKKNGWSPDCSENASEYQVLGLDSISKSTVITFDNVKFSDSVNKNFNSYIIHDNDFFISRGNTTDLVALASISHIDEDTPTTIYPDLMIKVTFDNCVNKQYIAYIFNSFIGRLYFKYAAKGKNQTMVKVSAKELSDFKVPIPDLKVQQCIVDKIQVEIDKQNRIKSEIARLRAEIEQTIVSTITTDHKRN